MSLLVLSSLEQFVPVQVRQRGTAYAHRGAVRLRRQREVDEPVSASVSGSDDYLITLRYDDRVLRTSCTCPYFDENVDICKHIWATLVECASRRIAFPGPIDDLIAEVDSDFDDFDEPPPPPLRFPSPSRWRAQIAATLHPSDLGENRRIPQGILWVLDPTTSVIEVAVEISSRAQKKSGELGKPQPLRIPHSAIDRLPDRVDREVLSMLSRYAFGLIDPHQSISWPAADFLLPKLVASGRLWIRTGKGEYATNVFFDDGEPWRLAVRADERTGKYVLTGFLQRGDTLVPVRDALAVTRGGFVIFHDTIARFADEETHGWASLLRRENVEIPAREINAFFKAVAASASSLPIEWPAGLAWQERRVPPRAVIDIRDRPWDTASDAVATFDYGGSVVNALTRTRTMWDESDKSIVVRDGAAEARLLDTLWDAGFAQVQDSLTIARARLAAAIPKLISAGWEVRGLEGTYAGFGELDLSLRSGIDWFDLHATATFGDESVGLPRLLTALRKGADFVRLGDGTLGLIRPEWREQLEPFLATAFDEHDEGLRFRRNQVVLLDALLATREDVSFDDVFDRARRRIVDVSVAAEEPPPSFRGTLRAYQKEALGWFAFLRDLDFGGCLADDMGLGKTIQVLALLDQRRRAEDRRPSLVVVPRSVVFNWKAEAERFTPKLRVLDHASPDRLPTTEHFAGYDVVLTTYALLRREVAQMTGVAFDYVILDEAQAIKNASSQAAKAVTLLKARHRLALTGTPVENHLGELASLFEFLNPGMLKAKSTRVTKLLREAGKRTAEAAESRAMLARSVRP
ncbi:MAG TPA: SNF2-related protein, partial [Thermoanaerobaculia bacterium]|nr:SNF2-related protein [Thermoanaerobaculia bacterium]